MTTEQAINRLNAAIDIVNGGLSLPLMMEAMRFHDRDDALAVWCAQGVYFEVSYFEIEVKTGQGLVNLVRGRLETVLQDLLRQVMRLGTYCRVLHGTQPWVLVQGL